VLGKSLSGESDVINPYWLWLRVSHDQQGKGARTWSRQMEASSTGGANTMATSLRLIDEAVDAKPSSRSVGSAYPEVSPHRSFSASPPYSRGSVHQCSPGLDWILLLVQGGQGLRIQLQTLVLDLSVF
jgi:hypothetical protein